MPRGSPLLALALAAGCGVSPDLYNQKVTEIGRLEQELSATRTELGAERKELAELRHDNDRLQRERAALDESRQKLASDLNTTSRQLDELAEAQKQAKARERA